MAPDEKIAKLEICDIDSIWDIFLDILTKTSGKLYESDRFENIFSPFMLCRYISMKESLVEYAKILNDINSTSKLTKKQFYVLAYQMIPKQSSSYIKYLKKQKKEKKKEEEQAPREDEMSSSLFVL